LIIVVVSPANIPLIIVVVSPANMLWSMEW
jgi:hypothetical protein